MAPSGRDFGAKLRDARESKGVSLSQISHATKIAVRQLEGLEQNDLSRLPGGIFTRAFVRLYAQHVGLDPDETLREFLTHFPDQTPDDEIAVAAMQTQHDAYRAGRSADRLSLPLVAALAVSGLLLIGALVYYGFLRQDGPAGASSASGAEPAAAIPAGAVAASPPAEPQPSAPSDLPRDYVAESSPAAIPIAPPPLPRASAAGAGPATPDSLAGADSMKVVIEPSGICWVRLSIDGKVVISRVLKAGDREEYEAFDRIVIDAGNASTFRYSINGRTGRPLGGAGQVATARITRENLATFLQP